MTNDNTAIGDEAAGELLRQQLDQVLPVDRLIAEAVPALLDRLRQELEPLTRCSLRTLLVSPATSLAGLLRIKDYGKHTAARSASTREEAAAKVIYFSAIASALVHHRQKISTHSYATLSLYFDVLLSRGWLPDELKGLMACARDVCRQHPAD